MHLLTLPGRRISLAVRCLYLQVARDKLHALTALGGDLLVHTVQGTDDQASLYPELHVEVPLASASTEEFLLPSTTMEHPSVFIRLVASTLSSVCARVSSRSSSTSRPNSSSKRASDSGIRGLRLHLISSSQAFFKPSWQSLLGCSAGHDALLHLLRAYSRSASPCGLSATSITTFLAHQTSFRHGPQGPIEDARQVSRRRRPGAVTATSHRFSNASTSTSARGPWGS
mmetsp:Transcript_17598/g.48331  ORF Transcript_17598/g.48331 Transcript_17598/m.48331 type:complete len:228 (-) Transcript_17598:408-1091(-)